MRRLGLVDWGGAVAGGVVGAGVLLVLGRTPRHAVTLGLVLVAIQLVGRTQDLRAAPERPSGWRRHALAVVAGVVGGAGSLMAMDWLGWP